MPRGGLLLVKAGRARIDAYLLNAERAAVHAL